MRATKIILGTTLFLAGLVAALPAQGQISINIGIQPTCAYGYYDYQPYACAPQAYYGPGYFYNGVFLGMGPWAGWGYRHGWGGHRFEHEYGGSYHGNGGYAANHGRYLMRGERHGEGHAYGHDAYRDGGHPGRGRGERQEYDDNRGHGHDDGHQRHDDNRGHDRGNRERGDHGGEHHDGGDKH